jgi:hypothetical protein
MKVGILHRVKGIKMQTPIIDTTIYIPRNISLLKRAVEI